jgi:hypothetical protein
LGFLFIRLLLDSRIFENVTNDLEGVVLSFRRDLDTYGVHGRHFLGFPVDAQKKVRIEENGFFDVLFMPDVQESTAASGAAPRNQGEKDSACVV